MSSVAPSAGQCTRGVCECAVSGSMCGSGCTSLVCGSASAHRRASSLATAPNARSGCSFLSCGRLS